MVHWRGSSRRRVDPALASEYGAVACIQSGKNTIGLAYAKPQNERWLKELKTKHFIYFTTTDCASLAIARKVLRPM